MAQSIARPEDGLAPEPLAAWEDVVRRACADAAASGDVLGAIDFGFLVDGPIVIGDAEDAPAIGGELTVERQPGRRDAHLHDPHRIREFGDRVEVKYVWNIMDLGYRAEDILWLVEHGLLTLGYQSSSYLTDRVPELGFVDLPFLFPDTNAARAAMDGALGRKLAQAIEARANYRILGWFENGFRYVSNRVRTVRMPADLKGMSIRVLPSKVQEQTFALLGAVRYGKRTPTVPTIEVKREEFLDSMQFRGEVKALSDVAPWRLAVVLETGDLDVARDFIDVGEAARPAHQVARRVEGRAVQQRVGDDHRGAGGVGEEQQAAHVAQHAERGQDPLFGREALAEGAIVPDVVGNNGGCAHSSAPKSSSATCLRSRSRSSRSPKCARRN